MMRMKCLWIVILLTVGSAAAQDRKNDRVIVGSKTFTESYILSEILAQIIEDIDKVHVERKLGMGSTGILNQAIRNGKIDLYPEYTGTIAEALLKDPHIRDQNIIMNRLEPLGLVMSQSLGFNNTYALAVRSSFAKKYGLKTISDLIRVPEICAGFSHEFIERPDGLPGLQQRYGFHFSKIQSMEHSLTYPALAEKKIDLTDVYTTDAKISQLDLQVLEDDLNFFPKYFAVILARKEFLEKYPRTWAAIQQLEGKIHESEMIHLNGLVDLERKSFAQVASRFLKKEGKSSPKLDSRVHQVWQRTQEHLKLVFIAVIFAVLVGLPLGVLASKKRWLGQGILLTSSVLQTIPSLALLCFLIPVFGIGIRPALVALFLYGLLPIVSGTTTGIQGIDSKLIESARALGLSPWQRLRLVELPLAFPYILGGIRTSTVISIGTATLAALIGAGGYGAPIVTGLAINHVPTILTGAIPAAALALVVHVIFEGIERAFHTKNLS